MCKCFQPMLCWNVRWIGFCCNPPIPVANKTIKAFWEKQWKVFFPEWVHQSLYQIQWTLHGLFPFKMWIKLLNNPPGNQPHNLRMTCLGDSIQSVWIICCVLSRNDFALYCLLTPPWRASVERFFCLFLNYVFLSAMFRFSLK